MEINASLVDISSHQTYTKKNKAQGTDEWRKSGEGTGRQPRKQINTERNEEDDGNTRSDANDASK